MSETDNELAPIADELYALRPADFAAARDVQVRKLRSDGRQPLVREVANLRKPTLSAWLINLLWRDQRDVMQQLFELAEELGRAQAQATGPALRELTTQRRQLETAPMRRAVELAEQAGVKINDAVAREAQETLSAALAQPEVADEVRSGRLVKPATYAGFGALPAAGASVRLAPVREPASEPIDLTAAQRAREEARRAAAEQRAQQARAAVDSATAAVSETSRAADTAAKHQEEVAARLEALRAQLRQLETEATQAERAAAAAARERDRAKEAHAAALAALQEAQRALTE